jgi:hypothetical protein
VILRYETGCKGRFGASMLNITYLVFLVIRPFLFLHMSLSSLPPRIFNPFKSAVQVFHPTNQHKRKSRSTSYRTQEDKA